MVPYRFFVSFCVFVPLLFLSGCGPKADYAIVPIEGVASYKGTPLSNSWSLEFTVGDRRASLGIIGAGGAFKTIHTPEIQGVPVGKAKVRVMWNDQGDPPGEYKEFFAKYGYDSEGLEIEITKPDKNLHVEFP